MRGYLTTAQAAERLKVTTQRVRELAAAGRLEGAVKAGRDWLIPAEAVEEHKRTRRPGRPPRREA